LVAPNAGTPKKVIVWILDTQIARTLRREESTSTGGIIAGGNAGVGGGRKGVVPVPPNKEQD